MYRAEAIESSSIRPLMKLWPGPITEAAWLREPRLQFSSCTSLATSPFGDIGSQKVQLWLGQAEL